MEGFIGAYLRMTECITKIMEQSVQPSTISLDILNCTI